MTWDSHRSKHPSSAERIAESSTRAPDGADVISSSLARELIQQAREEERKNYKPSAAAKAGDVVTRLLGILVGMFLGGVLLRVYGPQPASVQTCMELLKKTIGR